MLGGECLSVHDGKTCFIEGAIPGEEVEIRVIQEKKNFLRARVVGIIKPSSERVEPVCPHVTLCGGCQYQHMSYQEELRWKEAQVRETLEKALGAVRIQPIISGPKSYGYRRSATFHAVSGGRGKKSSFSYIGKDNKSAVILKQCDLLDPAIERMVLDVPMNAAGKIGYKLSASGSVVDDRKESFFRVKLLGKTLIAHSQAFFQNNWEVTEKMAEKVREWVSRAEPKVFFDLYAGVGTFSFLCAGGKGSAVAIEESRQAVSALRMNREESGWEELEILEGRVERIFPGAWEKSGSLEAVLLLDPPRTGMENGLCEYLAHKVNAKRLVYISCDPATLARDLRVLTEGNWKLEEAVPFDMFPRTKHVETVALLYYNEKT